MENFIVAVVVGLAAASLIAGFCVALKSGKPMPATEVVVGASEKQSANSRLNLVGIPESM